MWERKSKSCRQTYGRRTGKNLKILWKLGDSEGQQGGTVMLGSGRKSFSQFIYAVLTVGTNSINFLFICSPVRESRTC